MRLTKSEQRCLSIKKKWDIEHGRPWSKYKVRMVVKELNFDMTEVVEGASPQDAVNRFSIFFGPKTKGEETHIEVNGKEHSFNDQR